MKKILKVTVIFSLVFLASAYLLSLHTHEPAEDTREQIVAVNEISQLIQSGDTQKALQKADELESRLRTVPAGTAYSTERIILCGLAVFFFALIFGYVYKDILRPFEKMKGYAAEIARGNFDVPLDYDRSNYFGAFTWAFDSMRREITRSRACEQEAIENNKTVIATLSHDIKTPVASIRAYAEGLEANLDINPERRAKYLSVLMRKCDEVSALTDDLLLHSLSDMGMLRMQAEDTDIVALISDAAKDISGGRSDVVIHEPGFSAVVTADKKRMMQAAENLINNARKYAKTDIDISFTRTDDEVSIHFTDAGGGIPDEDMPFITDKFFRGSNSAAENGSGLGLYIVRYIAEQSGGKLTLTNTGKGLDAMITLPIKK